MRGCSAAGVLVLLVAVLLGEGQRTHGWSAPCREAEESHEETSPEVLQLLRKTGNAFKQVGDILLKKTGNSLRCEAGHQGHTAAGHPAPYGVYPQQSPVMYYPMQPVQPLPYVQSAPAVSYPVVPPYPVPQPVPQHQHVPQPVPQHQHVPQHVPQHAASRLSQQLVSLANEYEQAARNECSCESCGNVEVNMRRGPSSHTGKASDIVVEVTLGQLAQPNLEQCAGNKKGKVVEQKKTVNILNVSEASEEEEEEVDKSANTSSSASVEEKTFEETEKTHCIKVVETMNLEAGTSPLQVETFDNTATAVEKTIEKTVVVKSETEESETVERSSGETVQTIKTYEESHPRTLTAEQEISQVSQDNVENLESVETQYQSQHSNSYEEKVEIVEVQEEKLEELNKEASVGSEIFETVDMEQHQTQQNNFEKHSQKTSETIQRTESHSEFVSESQEQDVEIKVIDVESNKNVQHGDRQESNTSETNKNVDYYEYEYDTAVEGEDCLEKDAQDLQQYIPAASTNAHFASHPHPQYVSAGVEEKCHLAEGEHVLAEKPHPVESVQVVVQGTSAQTYAEGLQTHTSNVVKNENFESQDSEFGYLPQGQSEQHYHNNQCSEEIKPKPRPTSYEVPCEAHYGLPKSTYHQSNSGASIPSKPVHVPSYSFKKTNSYSVPQSQSYPSYQQQSYPSYQQQSYQSYQEPSSNSQNHVISQTRSCDVDLPEIANSKSFRNYVPAEQESYASQDSYSSEPSAACECNVHAGSQSQNYEVPLKKTRISQTKYSTKTKLSQPSAGYSTSQSYQIPQQQNFAPRYPSSSIQQLPSQETGIYSKSSTSAAYSTSQPRSDSYQAHVSQYSSQPKYQQQYQPQYQPQSYSTKPKYHQAAPAFPTGTSETLNYPVVQQSYNSKQFRPQQQIRSQSRTVAQQQSFNTQYKPQYPKATSYGSYTEEPTVGYSNYGSSLQRNQQTKATVGNQRKNIITEPVLLEDRPQSYNVAQLAPTMHHLQSDNERGAQGAQYEASYGSPLPVSSESFESVPQNQKTGVKLTPASYPAYYITHAKDSIYAPQMKPKSGVGSGMSQQSYAIPESYAAPAEDSKQSYEVPNTYSSVISGQPESPAESKFNSFASVQSGGVSSGPTKMGLFPSGMYTKYSPSSSSQASGIYSGASKQPAASGGAWQTYLSNEESGEVPENAMKTSVPAKRPTLLTNLPFKEVEKLGNSGESSSQEVRSSRREKSGDQKH